MSFGIFILTGLAAILVLEGLTYALFPDTMRKMLAMALEMPENTLRIMGFCAAATGFLLIAAVQYWI